MSVAYVKGQDAVTFGSPGCWNWQGDTWEVGLDSVENEDSLKDSLRRVKQLSLADMDLVYSSSSSGFETVTDLYLGYSVASITYNGAPAIVSSMPRTISTSELRVSDKSTTLGPVVYIFREDPEDKNKLQVLEKITPSTSADSSIMESKENKFTYFGYSLATVDVNGDGMEDVVIGAPFYHNDTHHDQGAIFIYLQHTVSFPGDNHQQQSSEMKKQQNAPCRIGQESYGRFGSCVAAVGDLDNDGFHDVAVGAPFLPEGGAVFIYMGSRDGLEVTYRQVIHAAEVSTHTATVIPLHGFGSSIAQQLPADSGLGYDVAVGAHSSDAVVVFRSKEILTLSWNLTFSGPMDLTKKSCDYTDTKGQIDFYPCVIATVCLISFKSISKEISYQDLEFSLILNADVNQQTKRLFFDSGTARLEKDVELQEGIEKCAHYELMAKNDIEEVIKSFMIKGEAKFKNKDGEKVMLSQHAQLLKEEKLDILVFCKSDDVHECQSDIHLSYNILKNYTLMATQPIVVSFMLENHAEAAYNTELIIDSHGDLAASESTNGITCENLNRIKKIRCEITTIFMTNSKMQFNLSMTPVTEFFDSLEQGDDVFYINASVITTSVLANADAATKTFKIPITVEGTLDLTKEPSFPGIVYYNSSSYYEVPSEAKVEEELGPEIIHKYKIFNGNKFSIYKTQVTIMWPLKIQGKYLFYLLNDPDFENIISNCVSLNGKVNPYNLKKNVSIPSNQREVFSGLAEGKMKATYDRSTRDSGLMGMIEYTELDCNFEEISAGGELFITLRSRLVQRTITELGMGSDLRNVSSWAQLQVLQMPLGADPPASSHTSFITTEISYQNESPEWVVPWWVYLVSVLGGLLVLVIIILIMWKCGFFKRKRVEKPDSMMEKKGDMQAVIEEDEDPQTPHSPMLKMTESANDDFQYSRPSSWVPS
ncbi:integrin alpha-8-like isoform X1 [Panulirus ornatus]